MKGMSDVHSQDIPSGNGKGKMMDHGGRTVSSDDEDTAMLQTASAMFGDLMDDLGPPLKALSATCTTSLKRLREAFAQPRSDYNKTTMQAADFQSLAEGIERALFTFESTSNHAVIRLYRSGNASGSQSRASFTSLAEDNQMLTGDESENVFLVYFFIFTLQEFAKELISLVDAMGRICGIERANARHRGWRERMKRAIKSIRSKLTRGGKKSETRRKGLRESLFSFPKIKPHAPNTIQTPARSNLTFIGRVKQSLWALGARLKENDLQYAIKAGMALAILASPAFFDSTRPIFTEYRGEWALISFFVVISPTVGATNFLGVHRVLGTLLGAATAAAYATSARFVLLTYNLTCLYCYNLRQKDIAVVEVAIHRAVAVTVGVVWAGIVSRFWWPTEARRELSKALGDFCLNMGWLYTRLVAFNSFADAGDNLGVRDEDHTPTEMTTLLSGSPSEEMTQSIQEFMAMELHLQIKLIELQGLLAQTSREPRLKGPFPVALYRTILTSLQTILDRLHSMRCVTSREEWHTTVRRDFILPVNKERREMVGNVILYFSTLAAAFRLKSPLPRIYLPQNNHDSVWSSPSGSWM
ncbi:Uncharacterized protein C26F1.08c [Grifola frondosa]|uniref:Uncharacterized protein C26F1.08c n=1 Tax=Grifola frondosa TaxID=5627 RepID=A0A1C7M290_GRIFR|nr:Uncharacterized protein C26F1.08c [Grifola frondosa]